MAKSEFADLSDMIYSDQSLIIEEKHDIPQKFSPDFNEETKQ